MPRRRPRQRPELPPTGLLDWTDSRHWDRTARPCRYCDQPTNLRDSNRKPAHKTCAEVALHQQNQDMAAAYENERLT
ncbi:hypothetical protein [Streptomyces chryseus]|uniref:hypothetical protein n=1 Tax=Streptomyces chryseus TaxID=68186 RepID=UPI00110F86DD|nr:hypothetical protein [Streptomyces chryseus]GGW99574.1 hypothetical protein GCM10010353_14070 [Streptomyces chryseus]